MPETPFALQALWNRNDVGLLSSISRSTSDSRVIPWEVVQSVKPLEQLGYQARVGRAIVADKVTINNECNVSGIIIADKVVLMAGSTITGVIICRRFKEAGGDVYGGNTYGNIWAYEEIQLHPDKPSMVKHVTAGPNANSQYSMIREVVVLEDEVHWMDDAVRQNASAIRSAGEELQLPWLVELVDGL